MGSSLGIGGANAAPKISSETMTDKVKEPTSLCDSNLSVPLKQKKVDFICNGNVEDGETVIVPSLRIDLVSDKFLKQRIEEIKTNFEKMEKIESEAAQIAITNTYNKHISLIWINCVRWRSTAIHAVNGLLAAVNLYSAFQSDDPALKTKIQENADLLFTSLTNVLKDASHGHCQNTSAMIEEYENILEVENMPEVEKQNITQTLSEMKQLNSKAQDFTNPASMINTYNSMEKKSAKLVKQLDTVRINSNIAKKNNWTWKWLGIFATILVTASTIILFCKK